MWRRRIEPRTGPACLPDHVLRIRHALVDLLGVQRLFGPRQRRLRHPCHRFQSRIHVGAGCDAHVTCLLERHGQVGDALRFRRRCPQRLANDSLLGALRSLNLRTEACEAKVRTERIC